MYSFIVKLRQTHTQKKVNLTKTLFYKVWEWCNLTPSRKCASVHRSVLLCFTILFFSPFRWHRFRTLSPCRPLVCSCLWRGCQHVSLPTPLSLSLSPYFPAHPSTEADSKTSVTPHRLCERKHRHIHPHLAVKVIPCSRCWGENRLKSEWV